MVDAPVLRIDSATLRNMSVSVTFLFLVALAVIEIGFASGAVSGSKLALEFFTLLVYFCILFLTAVAPRHRYVFSESEVTAEASYVHARGSFDPNARPMTRAGSGAMAANVGNALYSTGASMAKKVGNLDVLLSELGQKSLTIPYASIRRAVFVTPLVQRLSFSCNLSLKIDSGWVLLDSIDVRDVPAIRSRLDYVGVPVEQKDGFWTIVETKAFLE